MKITRTADKFVKYAERVEFTNSKGESVLIDIRRTTADKEHKNDLMNLWVKNGYFPHFIENRLTVQTYATTEKGDCFGWYNPTIKMHESGKRTVINFGWMLEDTPENRDKIIEKVIELANAEQYTNGLKNEIKTA